MKTFLNTLFIAFALTGFSQTVNTTYKDALEIKRRILLLTLPDNSKMVIRDYEAEDSTFAKMYKDDMEGQRMALKNAVLRYWTFTDSIQVVTPKQAKVMQRKEPEKYAVMKIGENVQDRVYIHSQPEPPQVAWIKSGDNLYYDSDMRYSIKMLGITTLVIDLPERAIEVFLPKVSPSEGDFINAITQMHYILSFVMQSASNSSNKLFRSLENSSWQLSDKTLLLDIAELAATNKEVREVYPYPFKIVSHKDIEMALKRKETNTLIITASRIDPHRTIYTLSNAGDGTIYYSFTEPTFSYGEGKGYAIAVLYPSLNANHLRRFGKIK